MVENNVELADSFIRAMACAALSPGLRSILVFDIEFEVLQVAAQLLKEMLEVSENQHVEQVNVGWVEDEDTLWGNFILDSDTQKLRWQPGLMTRDQSNLTLLVIPDLTQLSLAASRSCVMLIGADVSHLERHGQHEYWQPNICWLASCKRSESGQVSPHLLDRFALRLSKWRKSPKIDRVAKIDTWIRNGTLSNQSFETTLLPEDISNYLKNATKKWTQITSEAKNRISAYIQATTEIYSYYPRREIALARLAVANARLNNTRFVKEDDVDTSADILGLDIIETHKLSTEKGITQKTISLTENLEFDIEEDETETVLNLGESYSDESSDQNITYNSDSSETLSSISLPSPKEPYPEDKEPINREANSLRLPLPRYKPTIFTRGSIVGVERTKLLQDLAWVNTVLEAAKFQRIRHQNCQTENSKFQILSTDLRRYRRIPLPEQMLILLLDYTCLRGCNWEEALLPYLKWAYVERASIAIVQVGWADASNKLQAEIVTARSLLVRRINAALEPKPGKATPLAHGLDIVLRTLRSYMQHGRGSVVLSRLVILSDGRGNVPLDASYRGKILRVVNREGIEDALQIAQKISVLNNVETIFLNPQPQQCADLPLILASALGAQKIVIVSKREVAKT